MKNSQNEKIKVLVCAFACCKDPDTRFGFGGGGEGILGWNMVSQLNRFFQTHVLTHQANKESIEKKISEGGFQDTHFYYIALPKFLNGTKKIIQLYAYLWQIKAYFVAKKLHKKYHFDVFHHITYANDWMASFIGALLPILYIRGPGGGAHKVPGNFLKNYSLKQKLAEKTRSIGQWIFRHDPFFIIGHNRAGAVLVCNQEAFSALNKSWQKKSYFFPVNGISKEELLSTSKTIIYEDVFTVLIAGKLLKIKAVDLAIRAFKDFSAAVPEAQFVIIGDGPELENLKKLADQLGIQNKVVFEKWMPRALLLEKISLCDLFLFTSLRDGGGQVVVEAMAAGKPVICFDIAGPGFHVDEKWGIKIKPISPAQSIKDLSQALKKLYDDKNLRISLGQSARQRAMDFYSWDKLGDKLREIYSLTVLQ